MSGYYTGWRAQHYNTLWRTFTRRTLAETMAIIDVEALHQVKTHLLRSPRVLDVACGTGMLLKWIAERLPEAELYGVDASADMLTQARRALKGLPHVHLEQVDMGETIGLPYEPKTFDLITCTNALHDLSEPVEILTRLRRLLFSQGQLVVEDYARREHHVAFKVVEWLARRIESGHVRAYTLSEAESLSQQAGLHVVDGKTFTVNWLWHSWVLRLSDADALISG